MIIKNGLVWEESGSFRKKELVVDTTTHRIAETAEDDTVFDAEGLYVIPVWWMSTSTGQEVTISVTEIPKDLPKSHNICIPAV